MPSTSPEPQRTWQTGGKSFDYSDMINAQTTGKLSISLALQVKSPFTLPARPRQSPPGYL